MTKKQFRKLTGYAQILIVSILMLAAVLFYSMHYIRNVRAELRESTLNTIIESTEQAGNMIIGKIESEKYDSYMQASFFEKIASDDRDFIETTVDIYNSKKYPVVLVEGDHVYPEGSGFDRSVLETDTGDFGVIPPYISGINGRRVIAVASDFTFSDGVHGTIVREVSVNDLNNAFSVSFFQNHGHSYLINSRGDILFRSTNARGNKTSPNLFTVLGEEDGNDASAIEKVRNIIADGSSGMATFNYNAEENLYYFTPVQGSGWFLVSVVSEALINEQTQEILTQTFILAGIILAGFLMLIALLVYREHLNRREIEKENTSEKQMIIASNSEAKNIVLAIDPEEDSYSILSCADAEQYDTDHCETFTKLAESLAEHIDSDSRSDYLGCFCMSNFRKLLAGENKSEYREYQVDINGEKHWIAAEAVAVYTADHIGRIVYSSRNIDEAKAEEAEKREILQNALSMAEQANKAKTTFLNSMSHDIRTPMNAIIGFTALAISHIDDKELVVDYLKKISTSGNHLLSLINDVLDMSRIESGTIKIDERRVHLPDMVHDIRTIIQSSVNAKNIDFFIDTVDVVDEDILCDKLRLSQVMLNLLGNAVKYTRSGGTISVKVIQKCSDRSDYARYEFRIKDTGIGMSKEFQKHIFESFTREHSETVNGIQGTGLGMAITKNIVDMMGGSISVTSEIGVGSEFVVELYFKICGTSQKYEPIPELQGARVLVADDEPDTTINVSNMLSQIGMRPDWTLSGKEAVIRAKAAMDMQDPYAVYILDYLMPDMNGIETVRRIRAVIGDSTPIIVLTAYEWTNIEQEAREAGVTAFCEKPLFMSELRDLLSDQFKLIKPVKKEEPKRRLSFKGKKLLLVEDNELNKEIAAAILKEAGFDVDCVTDGIYAVEAISNAMPGQYDMILMDIQMPQMDGYTATREIRTLKNNPLADIPIIAVTANAFEADKRKALECGMNGYISKPINVDVLIDTLNSILAA